MPFALITIGILIFLTAINGTWKAFGPQVYKDLFSESGGFIYWVAGIVIVGLIGYIPQFKKPADTFMVLIIFAMIIKNGGFFQQFQAAIQAGPGATPTGSNAGPGASTVPGTSSIAPVTTNPLSPFATQNPDLWNTPGAGTAAGSGLGITQPPALSTFPALQNPFGNTGSSNDSNTTGAVTDNPFLVIPGNQIGTGSGAAVGAALGIPQNSLETFFGL